MPLPDLQGRDLCHSLSDSFLCSCFGANVFAIDDKLWGALHWRCLDMGHELLCSIWNRRMSPDIQYGMFGWFMRHT